MKQSRNRRGRGTRKSPSSGKISSLKNSRIAQGGRRWLWIVGAVVCVGVGGFFLIRRLWVEPEEKKVPSSRPAAAWSDPEPGAEPEEIAEHLKAEGLEVGRRIVRDLPDKADSILLMGQVHYRHGNSSEAMVLWKKGLKLDPKRADAYEGMGWIAMRKGDYETAGSHWQKALEIEPNMPGVHNCLARALMGLGKTEEAVSALEKDVKISPRSSMSYFLLGDSYLQLKKFEKAKEAYEKAIEVDPACTNAYYGLGMTFARLRQVEEAKEQMKKFRELKAEDMKTLKSRNQAYDDMLIMRGLLAQTHEDAGRIYQKHGRTREAEEHWRRAAALGPNRSSCRSHLASLYEQTGRISEAICMYEKVRELDPDNAVPCLSLASLYAQVERLADAEKALKKAIELEPELSWGYRDLARLYLSARRKPREAKALAQKAVDLEPIAANYDILGWALYANGDVAESLLAMQRATELDPNNAGYKRRYEQIRQRQ